MSFSFRHRDFALVLALPLLLSGGGCSESTDPVTAPIQAPAGFNPREVPFVRADHGPGPGEAEVSWTIVNWATFPIVEYQVALSYAGPVTTGNWDEAQILGRHPWRQGQVKFHEVYGRDQGLVQGATAWFAVRARDDHGNLSRLEESPRLTLSAEWWIEGHVYDCMGNPIPEAPVFSPQIAGVFPADTAGFFRIGPFRSIDQVELQSRETRPDNPWYGFSRHPLGVPRGQSLVAGQDFFLIPRAGLDPRCSSHDNEFLSYLRFMTLTNDDTDPDAAILHRWESYPLTVYIPAFVSDTGVAMDDAALVALELWNDVMGEEYFVRTGNRESADIEFRFEDRENFYGMVSLLSPSGPGMRLGRVVPGRMAVSIDNKLSSLKLVAEVSLHELGHTLGLLNHADCSLPEYLMTIAGGFGALDRDEPVHPDERRAVACIRHLPQGQDMAGYRLE